MTTTSDTGTAEDRPPKTIRLVGSLHLQTEPGGGALIVDDRTFTTARLNKSARILLEALKQPRTQEELATILADAANCGTGEATAPVTRFVEELADRGWIEP